MVRERPSGSRRTRTCGCLGSLELPDPQISLVTGLNMKTEQK